MARIIKLETLAHNHPMRNLPLNSIDASYKSRFSTVFAVVTPSYGISRKTYNELGIVWTKDTEWIAIETQDSLDWDEGRMDTIGQNGNDGLHY